MGGVAPIALQQSFWNEWNASHRETSVDDVSRRQAEVVLKWLSSLGRWNLEILDVGCGTGWLCRWLTKFGRVTGTDLAAEVLERARKSMPDVVFVAGDFMNLDFGKQSFDVAVSLEVLSHVHDQRAFLARVASLLRPGGHLMLATQDRVVLRYLNLIPPPAPGQLRRWVNRRELRELLEDEFEILEILSVTPKVGRGLGIKRVTNLMKVAGLRPSFLDGRNPAVWISAEEIGRARRGGWLTGQLEAWGLGWTLMALARKRA